MRVDVDEAGCHQQAASVDGAVGLSLHLADLLDASIGRGDVGRAGRGSGAIDDRTTSDHEVEQCAPQLEGSGDGLSHSGELDNFIGIDSPYEHPEDPDVRIDTLTMAADAAADAVLARLRATGAIP